MRWMPAASLGTSPAVPGSLDTTGFIRIKGEVYIKTVMGYLKAGEEEKTTTSQGPETFVTPIRYLQKGGQEEA